MKRIFIIVFLLCNSAIVYTQEDWLKTMNILDNKMPKELYYMRNEIYARHGKIFKTKELNEYFSDCSWYKPNPKFKENMFSVYEKETLNKIIRLEDELKPFADLINRGVIYREDQILANKTFPSKDIHFIVKTLAHGPVGEVFGYLYIFKANKIIYNEKIDGSFIENSSISIIELGNNNEYGIEWTYLTEAPQEGDFSSTHNKSTMFNFFYYEDNLFNNILTTSIYNESVPYDTLGQEDYKRAIYNKYRVVYEDQNQDKIKDIVVIEESTGKREITVIEK